MPKVRSKEERGALRGTCQVCLRKIRLTSSGTVYRHGWWTIVPSIRRDYFPYSAHTDPCWGSGKPPLEESCQVLAEAIGQTSIAIAKEAEGQDRGEVKFLAIKRLKKLVEELEKWRKSS